MVFVLNTPTEQDVDFELKGNPFPEFWYWRKHPDLHGWMKELYREKGGNDREFNSSCVKLNVDDILRLKRDIENENLPTTSGFFFGKSLEENKVEDLNFCEKALEELKKGKQLAYYSWW